MTNGEKYVTAQERAEAFLDHIGYNGRKYGWSAIEAFEWLDLEADKEKPLPCPFCGSVCKCENFGDVNKIECQNVGNYGCSCQYQSGGLMSAEDAISAHNRIVKIIKESKKQND